jgi:hypothetical protein
MQKIKSTLQGIFRSFPFQLGLAHLQHNLFLLSIFAFLLLIIFGQLGRTYGFHFLFLKPIYLGETGFLSFVFLGLTLGWLIINWNLTTYILHSHRFPFLATLGRPFIKFSFNNFFFPFVFLLLYVYSIWSFEKNMELLSTTQIFIHIGGLLVGMFLILGVLTLYFRYTNKDLNREIKVLSNIQKKVESSKTAQTKLAQVFRRFKEGDAQKQVEFFVTERGKVRPVRDVTHYSEEEMLKIFKHNHSNIISIQLLSIVILFVSGIFSEVSFLQIPAAASVFLLMSLILSLFGAISYWFAKWRFLAILVFLLFWNQISKQQTFNHSVVAYGLDYNSKADYSVDQFREKANAEQMALDKAVGIQMLENWKAKQVVKAGEKPKLVMLSSSGGGLKSAVWSFHVMQQLDSLLEGQLMHHTTLMTGASGGMIGQAYYRALFEQSLRDTTVDLRDEQYLLNLKEDLLNAVLFSYVSTDLFLPIIKKDVYGERQPMDRAYAFEKRLNTVTGNVFDKPITAYQPAEVAAEIPMLLMSPSIVNDGRLLYLSAQGVSYMMANPNQLTITEEPFYDGVDFGLLFEDQQASNLRFSSAVRMNASFPYVLPNVNLPSDPGIQVLDAGLRDNFGLKTCIRFAHVFKDWIKENTSGVVVVELRAFERDTSVGSLDNIGVLEGLLNPLALAGDIVALQNFENDNNLGYLSELLGPDMLHHIQFLCTNEEELEELPISLNLSQLEYNEIIQNLEVYHKNQEAIRQFLQLVKP